MLKMLIVDDEEIICNTIAKIIDWEQMGIQLAGTCLNGVEAYHAILDESPDIVMTDIRMPGISGLELIERISHTNLNTQFIILSGYGEFEYAKQAMKSGVRHYLLKPCDKNQIIDCIKEVIRDCVDLRQREELKNKSLLFNRLHTTLIHNVISAGTAISELSASFFDAYEKYMDFTDTPYQLCCLYYLEISCLDECLRTIALYLAPNAPQLSLYKVYLSNVLLLFFPDYSVSYRSLDHFMNTLSLEGQKTAVEYERKSYPNLKHLLHYLIPRLKRYDVIYFVDEGHLIPNFNYDQITSQISLLCPRLTDDSPSVRKDALGELADVLASITGRSFFLQAATQLLVSVSTYASSTEIAGISDFLSGLTSEPDLTAIQELTLAKCREIIGQAKASENYSAFISEIISYLKEHISDSNITLKWIAENHLYMNVKYVSRCFSRETGQTFSSYLTGLRIEKAKEILSGKDAEKIQNVAELVGCGNNPYYFSKIFKKTTAMTPTAYVKKIQSASNP